MIIKESQIQKRNQYQFESFCKKVIRSERCDYLRWLLRHSEHEINFSDLPAVYLEHINTVDQYAGDEYVFIICGHHVSIRNERLAESLLELSQEGRGILILSYSLGFNDREIGELLGIAQRQIQRLRTKYFKVLQTKMKG